MHETTEWTNQSDQHCVNHQIYSSWMKPSLLFVLIATIFPCLISGTRIFTILHCDAANKEVNIKSNWNWQSQCYAFGLTHPMCLRLDHKLPGRIFWLALLLLYCPYESNNEVISRSIGRVLALRMSYSSLTTPIFYHIIGRRLDSHNYRFTCHMLPSLETVYFRYCVTCVAR